MNNSDQYSNHMGNWYEHCDTYVYGHAKGMAKTIGFFVKQYSGGKS